MDENQVPFGLLQRSCVRKPKSGTLPHPRTVVLSQLPLESARFHYEKFPFSKLSGSTQLRRNSAKLRRRVGTRSKRIKKKK